jgi:dienelactone hydrolase
MLLLKRVCQSLTAFFLVAAVCQADESNWVSFEAATLPASPLKVRLAKAKGEEVKKEPGTTIGGYFFRPDGLGPFPAVVFSHDCRGVRPYHREWASLLKSWGFAVLLVDSFTPRNVEVAAVCKNLAAWDLHEELGGRPFDIYGALEYLAMVPIIDRNKLATMSWDRGGLALVAEVGAQQHFDTRIQGAIGMSQDCRSTMGVNFMAPVLILTGKDNDWWPAETCAKMLKGIDTERQSVELVVYEGALHSFDDQDVGEKTILPDAFNHNKTPAIGATLGYNADVHKDSIQRVKQFLDRTINTDP